MPEGKRDSTHLLPFPTGHSTLGKESGGWHPLPGAGPAAPTEQPWGPWGAALPQPDRLAPIGHPVTGLAQPGDPLVCAGWRSPGPRSGGSSPEVRSFTPSFCGGAVRVPGPSGGHTAPILPAVNPARSRARVNPYCNSTHFPKEAGRSLHWPGGAEGLRDLCRVTLSSRQRLHSPRLLGPGRANPFSVWSCRTPRTPSRAARGRSRSRPTAACSCRCGRGALGAGSGRMGAAGAGAYPAPAP